MYLSLFVVTLGVWVLCSRMLRFSELFLDDCNNPIRSLHVYAYACVNYICTCMCVCRCAPFARIATRHLRGLHIVCDPVAVRLRCVWFLEDANNPSDARHSRSPLICWFARRAFRLLSDKRLGVYCQGKREDRREGHHDLNGCAVLFNVCVGKGKKRRVA